MDDFKRYARQMILPEIGKDGQRRISAANVLCVGAGGLGCPALLYLAGAGVGHIGVVDDDCVDESNLQRQVLYTMADVGRSKAEVARERLLTFNPQLDVTAYTTRLTSENAEKILRPYDIVIDGSDNFPTRFLVNDACVMLGKPLVYGSVLQWEGQASVFDARNGPCYRCLFPEIPTIGPSCAEAGVLGVLPGLVGTLQATETLKLILNAGESLRGRLIMIDARTATWKTLHIEKDPSCACCSKPVYTLHTYASGDCMANESITSQELKKMIADKTPFTLVDVREPDEYEICKISGSKLIPLKQLPNRLGELNKDALIVLHCHHGRRSMMALQFMQEEGFTQLKNLEGGIDAWAEACDPQMTRY